MLIGPRYGYWAWELPRAPARWLKLTRAALVDEVWAPSRYTRRGARLRGRRPGVRVVQRIQLASRRTYASVVPAPRRKPFQGVSVLRLQLLSGPPREPRMGRSPPGQGPSAPISGSRARRPARPQKRVRISLPRRAARLLDRARRTCASSTRSWPYARHPELDRRRRRQADLAASGGRVRPDGLAGGHAQLGRPGPRHSVGLARSTSMDADCALMALPFATAGPRRPDRQEHRPRNATRLEAETAFDARRRSSFDLRQDRGLGHAPASAGRKRARAGQNRRLQAWFDDPAGCR